MRRWPLLATGLFLLGAAVGVGAYGNESLTPVVEIALLALAAGFLGAFIHSEGGRGRGE